MLIKATQITNLTDARYFAAREVNFLGFNLEEGTAGYLDPMYMRAIREWVEGPAIIGEFARSPVEVVREAVAFFGLDAVQVKAGVHLNELPQLQGLNVLLELEAGTTAQKAATVFQQAEPYVQFFIVPFLEEAPADIPDLDHWQRLFAQYPVLLHTQATAEQLPAWLAALHPKGWSLTGGEEERVGVKSFDQIEDIFEVLENMSELNRDMN